MKMKDLLIPATMLAIGAGIGFWARERQPSHAPVQSDSRFDAGADSDAAGVDIASAAARSSDTPIASGEYGAAGASSRPGHGNRAALPPENANVAEVYAVLKPRAQGGDASAACRLAFDLLSCEQVAQSAAITDLVDNEVLRAEDVSRTDELDRSSKPGDKTTSPAARCAGVGHQQLAEVPAMLFRAASAGHLPSMLRYLRNGGISHFMMLSQLDDLERYRRALPAILDGAARAGSIDAIQLLANMDNRHYRILPVNQVYADRLGPVELLGFKLLYEMARLEPADASPSTQERITSMRQKAQAEGKLTRAQVAEAEQLATERFASWFGGVRAPRRPLEMEVESTERPSRSINTVCADGPWTAPPLLAAGAVH